MTALEFTRRIIAVLEGDEPIKNRLASAAAVFWSATFEADPWPAALQPQADDLLARLLDNGAIRQTVERMNEATAHETAELLLRFAREFETTFD